MLRRSKTAEYNGSTTDPCPNGYGLLSRLHLSKTQCRNTVYPWSPKIWRRKELSSISQYDSNFSLIAGPNQYVDHKNRNRYDNRKSNLRCCTYAENNRNRGLCATNKSGVIGVHFDKKRNKWTASITLNGKKIFIGRFENKEAAIQARLQKEHELFGEFAPQQMLIYSLLNFKALVPK